MWIEYRGRRAQVKVSIGHKAYVFRPGQPRRVDDADAHMIVRYPEYFPVAETQELLDAEAAAAAKAKEAEEATEKAKVKADAARAQAARKGPQKPGAASGK